LGRPEDKMKVVTAEEMRIIDEKTMEHYGITGTTLMERAGLAVADRICGLFDKGKVIVLSGGGNNGGDGIVAARILFSRGWNVKVLLMTKEEKLGPGCLEQFRIAGKIGVPVEFRAVLNRRDLHSAVIVDALLGTGLNQPVTQPLSEVISFLNNSEATVISIDIPSGISSDDGQVRGIAVSADYTVTFGLPKIGHFLHPGAEYTGRLFVENIGFPAELLNSESLKTEVIEKKNTSFLVPERTRYSHKGDYGHVLIVAGSKGKTGAALMSAKACLRAGAGMVTLGVPETLVNVFQARVTEEMVLPLPDNGEGILSGKASAEILDFLDRKADILAIGPGISAGSDIKELLVRLLPSVTAPMVLDADAINAIRGRKKIFSNTKAPVIITPHTGEFASLLAADKPTVEPDTPGRSGYATEIEQDRLKAAVSFSKEKGLYLVLKGVPTVIAEPDGRAFINTSGNAGMATAGSGDVLTGIIAGLLGQGMNPVNASILGVYLHGLAGDIAAAEKGMHSLIASDITDKISGAFAQLRQ
jgi:ADP-dependent NAD(P)H-hydrate dehydratase / NAD(P)H-hydrate epimerase